jgi:hypothetical protein
MTPPKVNNFIVTDLNNSAMDAILNKEFKRLTVRMINKIKEDKNKHLNEFKENINS